MELLNYQPISLYQDYDSIMKKAHPHFNIHYQESEPAQEYDNYSYYQDSEYSPSGSHSSVQNSVSHNSINSATSVLENTINQNHYVNNSQQYIHNNPHHTSVQHMSVMNPPSSTNTQHLMQMSFNQYQPEFQQQILYDLLKNKEYPTQSFDMNQYPDVTTFVNANSNMVIPLVDTQFVDHKVCTICSKRITRDMSRHMRTHQPESRFTCKFPKTQCRHKLGKFNRPYDYKKHLLNRHFKFDNVSIKKLHNLSDKLSHWGTCPCGNRFIGKDWLQDHILTEGADKCPCVE